MREISRREIRQLELELEGFGSQVSAQMRPFDQDPPGAAFSPLSVGTSRGCSCLLPVLGTIPKGWRSPCPIYPYPQATTAAILITATAGEGTAPGLQIRASPRRLCHTPSIRPNRRPRGPFRSLRRASPGSRGETKSRPPSDCVRRRFRGY